MEVKRGGVVCKGQSLALLGKAATRWHQSFPAAILSQAIWPTSISV